MYITTLKQESNHQQYRKKYTKYTAVIKIAISIIKSKFIWEKRGPGGCAREHRNLLKLNECALCLTWKANRRDIVADSVFIAGLFKWHEYARF